MSITKTDSHLLFGSNISTYYINPSDYKKELIINTIIKNYKLSSTRNNWSDRSNLHHYYNDWNNSDFFKVDLSSLIPCYNNLLFLFFDSFNLTKKIDWSYFVSNITVYSDQSHFMEEHDHYHDNIVFAAVHYLQKDINDSGLTFTNPLISGQFPGSHHMSWAINHLSNLDSINSSFFNDWTFQTKEDEIIIFPSYLKHRVLPSPREFNNYRIAIALNISVKK